MGTKCDITVGEVLYVWRYCIQLLVWRLTFEERDAGFAAIGGDIGHVVVQEGLGCQWDVVCVGSVNLD